MRMGNEERLNKMLPHTPDQVVTASAVGAITSIWWLPSLHSLSSTAAEIAPILGCAWLVLQILLKAHDSYKKASFRKEITAHLKGTLTED